MGITSVNLITFLAICFPVGILITTKKNVKLWPGFNLKAFEWQQWYNICLYMELFVICPSVYNLNYSLSDRSWSMACMNMGVRMFGSSWPPIYSMKSHPSIQCLTSVHEAWSYLNDKKLSLPFNNQWTTIQNIWSNNSKRLFLIHLPASSHKSVASYLLPLPSLFPPLPNIACTIFKIHINSLWWNPFSIMNIFQMQRVLKSHQKICHLDLRE